LRFPGPRLDYARRYLSVFKTTRGCDRNRKQECGSNYVDDRELLDYLVDLAKVGGDNEHTDHLWEPSCLHILVNGFRGSGVISHRVNHN
jgi:hypothetical protein